MAHFDPLNTIKSIEIHKSDAAIIWTTTKMTTLAAQMAITFNPQKAAGKITKVDEKEAIVWIGVHVHPRLKT